MIQRYGKRESYRSEQLAVVEKVVPVQSCDGHGADADKRTRIGSRESTPLLR